MTNNNIEITTFYQATNPTKTIEVSNPHEKPYYIDFAEVRGGPIIEKIHDRISFFSGGNPTYTLFTGHIGCGKSTELFCLKNKLEQDGFQVVYFACDEYLELNDVEVSDILLAIASNISCSLDKITIQEPKNLTRLLKEAAKILNTEIDITKVKLSLPTPKITMSDSSPSSEGIKIGEIGVTADNTGQFSLAFGIGEITAKVKSDATLRHRLNEFLAPQKTVLLDAINEELLEPATVQLKEQGKKGLVVIVDNLDRLDSRPKTFGRPQQEYIFIDQAEHLTKLKCHVLYTMPLALKFVSDYGILESKLEEPRLLPMVATHHKNGEPSEVGMALLRQMVLARALPQLTETERLEKICEIFDQPETLDRLCMISGGHVRQLLQFLNRWIEEEKRLPLTAKKLEKLIISRRNDRKLTITGDEEWELLKIVKNEKKLKPTETQKYQALIKNLSVFQYYDDNGGSWFDINPVLLGSEELEN